MPCTGEKIQVVHVQTFLRYLHSWDPHYCKQISLPHLPNAKVAQMYWQRPLTGSPGATSPLLAYPAPSHSAHSPPERFIPCLKKHPAAAPERLASALTMQVSCQTS